MNSGIGMAMNNFLKAMNPHFQALKTFHFSYTNPLFWAFLFILFLILLNSWKAKKAFSFCSLVGAILLINSQIENYILRKFVLEEGFDPAVVMRVISGVLIIFLAIYYFLIRED